MSTNNCRARFTIVKAHRTGQAESFYFAIPKGRHTESFHATCLETLGRYVAIYARHESIALNDAYEFADRRQTKRLLAHSWIHEGLTPDVLNEGEQKSFIAGLSKV